MSILNDILNSVGQGLTEAIGDNSMNLLTSLQDPDEFDTRQELSEVMESVFGDDLTSHFDRRTLAATLRHECKAADDKACQAMIDGEKDFIARALEVFGDVRDDVLDVAMHETLKSEFGEGIRSRAMTNINAAIRAAATGEDDEADEGLIPDADELEDDPPLTDELGEADDDDDNILFSVEEDD